MNYSITYSTDTFVIVSKDNEIIDINYIYYYLRHNLNILEQWFKWVWIKHISKEFVNEINFTYPIDIIEQRIIFNFISEIDNKIEK